MKYVQSICGAFIELLFILLLGEMIESIFYENNLSYFSMQICAYIILFLVHYFSGKMILRKNNELQKKVQMDLRILLYGRAIRAKALYLT